MKRGILGLLLLLTHLFVYSQIEDPVKWSYSTNDLGNNEFELLFKASIEEGWHLYSQNLPSDDGPIATSFTFKPSDSYKLIEIGRAHV